MRSSVVMNSALMGYDRQNRHNAVCYQNPTGKFGAVTKEIYHILYDGKCMEIRSGGHPGTTQLTIINE